MARKLLAATLVIFCLLILESGALAGPVIRMTTIYFNPPGEDRLPEPNSDLRKEKVRICNFGDQGRSISRWKLTDGRAPNIAYTFPEGFRLPAGECVFVHTGSGRDSRDDLYLNLDAYVWNNDGDRATLRNRLGTVKQRCPYGRRADRAAFCLRR